MLQTIYRPVLILFIYFLLSSFGVDPKDYFFKRISIEQGLSHAGVSCIVRDFNGILWVGTRQGLNKVNRNNLKSYFHDRKNSFSLPGNYIYCLHEDQQHNLWVASDGGLSRYDRTKDRFETEIPNRIQSVLNIQGGVLFGGYEALFFYSYQTKQLERLPLINKDPSRKTTQKDYLIAHMALIDEKTILVGTEGDGLFFYHLDTYGFTPFGARNIQLTQSMFLDPQTKEVYISAFQQGVFRYDLSGHLKEHYTTKNAGLSNGIVLDIKKHDGKIWLATDGSGIDILDPSSGTLINTRHIPGDINSLPVNSITVLYSDQENNLWAGTVRDGIFLLKETYIKTYRDVALGSNKGLAERAVISLLEDSKGKIWIGTDGGGINMFDPRTETFRHYANTYGDKISSITDYSDTEFLVSLYGKGLFIYNINTQRYRPFVIIDERTNAEECLSGFTPFSHKIQSDKILILAKNAYLYNPRAHTFEKVRHASGEQSVFALQLVYSDDKLSFLTKGNTIYTLGHDDGIVRKLLVLGENEYVNSVCYDKAKNKLWIATAEGLKHYEINTGRLEKVETSMFDRISYMCLDKERDRLWINASNMLFSYDINNGKFVIWDDSDGFLPNNILTLYTKPSPSDYIYMGGSNGLVKINKRISNEDDRPVSLRLQDVELNGKVHLGSKIAGTEKLTVPQHYSSLKIRVDINEKDLFRHILFRYKINSQNNSSIIESYSNVLDLTSLAPGKYEIYVSCMTKNGDWSQEANLLAFEVIPPWYKRIGFILAIICALTALAALAVLSWIKRNKRRLEWKMAIHRQQLNEDKIQFLTNVSHELRTPLTLIYAPLKRMLDSDDTESLEQRKKIEKIYQQTKHMKGIIDWVLDYDRTTTLVDDLNLTLVDPNNLLRRTVGDFESELHEKNIQPLFELDHRIQPIVMDEAKIRVVISNLLMNALKFSPPHGDIMIKSKKIEKVVRIEITDRGIGLKDEDIDQLFTRFYQGQHGQKGSGIGLSYCKELVERHNGYIGGFNNKEHEGATVYFELPYTAQMIDTPTQSADSREGVDESSTMEQHLTKQIDPSLYTILLVDDNREFLLYMESELKLFFKKVWKAGNGLEALELLKSNMPDILISDVAMPTMNGYDLCRNVKNNIEISHIPIILLTAKSDTESQKTGYKSGADFYLPKPFDIDLLLSVVQNLLRSKELIKQKYQTSLSPFALEKLTISNADEQFMSKLNLLIAENFSDPSFDVSVVIDKLAMSRASLYSKMKGITGLGINDYINKHRITVACTLLADTDKSMADIAFETGFTSQRYFSMAFKKNTGETPSSYRTLNRKEQHDV